MIARYATRVSGSHLGMRDFVIHPTPQIKNPSLNSLMNCQFHLQIEYDVALSILSVLSSTKKNILILYSCSHMCYIVTLTFKICYRQATLCAEVRFLNLLIYTDGFFILLQLNQHSPIIAVHHVTQGSIFSCFQQLLSSFKSFHRSTI